MQHIQEVYPMKILRRRPAIAAAALAFILFAAGPCLAGRPEAGGLKVSLLEAIQLPGEPLDMAVSLKTNKLFVLTGDRALYAYTLDGTLIDSVALDHAYTKLKINLREDVLFLIDAGRKRVQALRVEFFNTIGSADRPFKGAENAPVTLAVFSDFQCPYCRELGALLDRVVQKYPDKVKLVYKTFPLRSHRWAKLAAQAALAAADKGKFWELHDLLYADFSSLNQEKIMELADTLGLDRQAFEKQMQDQAVLDRINEDVQEGTRAGVTSVPALFINGYRLDKRSFEEICQRVDEELGKEKIAAGSHINQ